MMAEDDVTLMDRREVSTLLGHAHVALAARCLGSLLRWATPPVRLRVYDDGTLTSQDAEVLNAQLGEPVFVRRPIADERVSDMLARHPAARAFRADNPLGAKLLDVVLLASGEVLAYCDADVLFFRRFAGLFELPPGSGALFMADPQNAYSVRSWHLLNEPRLRLAAHLNSGILTFRQRSFDLDLVEWFLAKPEYRFAPVWVEQTCWALLAQAAGCLLLDPARISIPAPGESTPSGLVAYHFVSPVRNILGGFRLPEGEPGDDEATVTVGHIPSCRLTPGALAATEIRRRLKRW
jgi:hypothetical protein